MISRAHLLPSPAPSLSPQAMKLISLVQAGEVLPANLPSSLIPPSKSSSTASTSSIGSPTNPPIAGGIMSPSLSSTPKTSSLSAQGSPMPPKKYTQPSSPSSLNSSLGVEDVEWVVSAELKSKYDGYFQGIDKDHDGYISGEEARSLFMASNLPQEVLAHIWSVQYLKVLDVARGCDRC